MTAERLLAAIRHLDPDGNGESRVIVAAQRCQRLVRQGVDVNRLTSEKALKLGAMVGGADCCVLAFAWRGQVDLVRATPTVLTRDGRTVHNPFLDVVEWFDQVGAEGVLKVLGCTTVIE